MLSEELFYVVPSKLLVRSASELTSLPANEWPELTYKVLSLLKINLLNADGTNYTDLSDAVSASFSVDNDFSDSSDNEADPGLMVKTLATDINKTGDWDAADYTTGKLSVRCNCATEGFGEKCGTSESAANCKGELKLFDSSANLIGAIKIPVVAYNLQDDDDGTIPAPVSDYYTAAKVEAVIASIAGLRVVSTYAELPELPDEVSMYWISDSLTLVVYDLTAGAWVNMMGGIVEQ